MYFFCFSQNTIQELTKKAESGNIKSQVSLGIKYYEGSGVPIDYQKAFYWLKKASDKGNNLAKCYLGLIYYYGNGVSINYNLAFDLFIYAKNLDINDLDIEELPADGFFTNSNKALINHTINSTKSVISYILGDMYYFGEGTNKNIFFAIQNWTSSAELGNPYAQLNLGIIYQNGTDIMKDQIKSMYWFQKSAEQENAEAQLRLGAMYLDLNEKEKGIYWIKKSKENGNKEAQNFWERLELWKY